MAWTYAGEYAGDVLYKTKGSAGGVSVAVADSLGAPAVLYTDRTKALTTGSSAVTTDSLGNLSFFADPGTYACTVLNGGTFTAVVPIDPAELAGDVSGLATAASLAAEAARAEAAEAALSMSVTAAISRAEYNSLYRTAMLDGYAAWTYDYWTTWQGPAPSASSFPSGGVVLNLFYLPVALTLNGFMSTDWRGTAGYSNASMGLYSIDGSGNCTLQGSVAITSTSHMVIRQSVGVTQAAAGWWAFGFVVGTQGSTFVGPITSSVESIIGASGFSLSSIGAARSLLNLGTATSLPPTTTLSAFRSTAYSFGWWALD